MLFRGKPLLNVSEAELYQLIVDQIEEGKLIDYKRDLPRSSADDKKEFLHDITSFANTAGGHLLFGIDEAERVPIAIPGVSPPSIDQCVLQLESWVRDLIEPRIAGFHVQPVKLTNGGFVVVLQIPRSWAGPHMVKLSSKFYARNSGGKFQLDVGEIRSAFLASESIGERIRGFRADRLMKIVEVMAPSSNYPPRVILHVCPISSFRPGFAIDLTKVVETEELKCQPFPLGCELSAVSSLFTFEGRCLYCLGNDNKTRVASSLLFRNGSIETWNSQLILPDYRGVVFEAGVVENAINAALKSYLPFLATMGVDAPLIIMISILGAAGFRLDRSRPPHFISQPLDSDQLILPEVVFEDANVDLEKAMRPAYDVFWNACGMASCFLYDNNGEWKG